MRTTLDLDEKLLSEAMAASGKKTKKATIEWALEMAMRDRALEQFLNLERAIEFEVSPDEHEAREIEDQYGSRRSRHRRHASAHRILRKKA